VVQHNSHIWALVFTQTCDKGSLNTAVTEGQLPWQN